MKTIRCLSLAALLAVPFVPAEARGQGLTGALVGTVKDPSGARIPGALVRITSPALIGGERETTSTDRGVWRLVALPPGEYTLTVEMAPRFAAHHETMI